MAHHEPTDRLLGIGEFANSVGLSISAVRFYADRGLLTPAAIDPATGYRSFQPGQVATGCLIRDLRRIEMSLSTISDALLLSTRELSLLVEAQVAAMEANAQEARSIARRLGEVYRTSPASSSSGGTTVRASDLRLALEQVLPFVSSDPESPHLMTVRVEVKAGSVRLVTTDTHRLAVRDLVPLESGGDFCTLLASGTARRWQSDLATGDDVTLTFDGTSLSLDGGPIGLSAPEVPATFPDYESVMTPPNEATVLVVERREFLDALQRFDGEDAVLMSAGGDGLRIERGELQVHTEASCDGPHVHVAINPLYGLECAVGAIGAEVIVEIEDDPLRPVLFRSATDGTYVSLLMPVKLD